MAAAAASGAGSGGGGTAGRNFSFKVVLLGEGCVGKTSLVLRYCENKFNDKHITTLQVGARGEGGRPPRLWLVTPSPASEGWGGGGELSASRRDAWPAGASEAGCTSSLGRNALFTAARKVSIPGPGASSCFVLALPDTDVCGGRTYRAA